MLVLGLNCFFSFKMNSLLFNITKLYNTIPFTCFPTIGLKFLFLIIGSTSVHFIYKSIVNYGNIDWLDTFFFYSAYMTLVSMWRKSKAVYICMLISYPSFTQAFDMTNYLQRYCISTTNLVQQLTLNKSILCFRCLLHIINNKLWNMHSAVTCDIVDNTALYSMK